MFDEHSVECFCTWQEIKSKQTLTPPVLYTLLHKHARQCLPVWWFTRGRFYKSISRECVCVWKHFNSTSPCLKTHAVCFVFPSLLDACNYIFFPLNTAECTFGLVMKYFRHNLNSKYMYIDSYLANGPSLVLIKNVTNWEPLYNVIYVWIKLSPFFTLNAHLVCVFILQAGSAKQ